MMQGSRENDKADKISTMIPLNKNYGSQTPQLVSSHTPHSLIADGHARGHDQSIGSTSRSDEKMEVGHVHLKCRL